MIIKSLHFRVTAWYTLALTAILLIFSTFIYQNFKHSLFENLESLLKSKAENIDDLINSYREEDVPEKKQASTVSGLRTQNPEFLQAVRSVVQEERGDSIFVQILGPQGERLDYSNKAIAQIIPIVTVSGALSQGNIQYENVKNPLLKNTHEYLRVLTTPS